jgi:hypothetical protein
MSLFISKFSDVTEASLCVEVINNDIVISKYIFFLISKRSLGVANERIFSKCDTNLFE